MKNKTYKLSIFGLTLIQTALILMKASNNTTMSWIAVFSPIWIPVLAVFITVMVVFISIFLDAVNNTSKRR